MGGTCCKYVFRIQSLPGETQLPLLGSLTLSHNTSDSPFPGPSTTTQKAYAIPPILEGWDTTKATKELSEMSQPPHTLGVPVEHGFLEHMSPVLGEHR